MSSSEGIERMTFLDVLINTLVEHEKQISHLEDKLETLIDAFEDIVTEAREQHESRKNKPRRIRHAKANKAKHSSKASKAKKLNK